MFWKDFCEGVQSQKYKQGQVYDLKKGHDKMKAIKPRTLFTINNEVLIIEREYNKVDEFVLEQVFGQGDEYQHKTQGQGHPVQRNKGPF